MHRLRTLNLAKPFTPSRKQSLCEVVSRLMLAAVLGVLATGRADASAYYSVTYVGSGNAVSYDWNSVPEGVTNKNTGVYYPFTTTVTPTNTIDWSALPSGTAQRVNDYLGQHQWHYIMSVTATNTSGTVIGSIPGSGSDGTALVLADGTPRTLGYSVKTADGHYTPFTTLLPPWTNGSTQGFLALSQSNQILIENLATLKASVFDVKSATTTPLFQLIPPAMLQQMTGSPTGDGTWTQADGIDDRGDILVLLGGNDAPGNDGSLYILTPPGLAPPTPTPEPSTFLIFGIIGAGAAIRRVARRNRKRA